MTRSARPAAGGWKRVPVLGALALCGAAAIVSACSNSPEVVSCDKDTGASGLAGNLAIQYQASLTLGGKATSITYTTDAGDVVVTNPTLPWEVDVTNVTNPARIHIVGTITGSGTLVAQYSADGGEDRTAADETGCTLNVSD